MSFSVAVTDFFEHELKALAKRHRSLKNDLAALVTELEDNPFIGTDIGNHCRKIRLAVTSKGKGKSCGARVITYLHVAGKTVFLLSIYDKAEQSSLSDSEFVQLITEI